MQGEYSLKLAVTVPTEPNTWEDIAGPIIKGIEKAEAEFQKNVISSSLR